MRINTMLISLNLRPNKIRQSEKKSLSALHTANMATFDGFILWLLLLLFWSIAVPGHSLPWNISESNSTWAPPSLGPGGGFIPNRMRKQYFDCTRNEEDILETGYVAAPKMVSDIRHCRARQLLPAIISADSIVVQKSIRAHQTFGQFNTTRF